MAMPFAARWEVTSLRWNHGSFVEAAKVKPLLGQGTGDWWVERTVADLRPAHRARVQRRWWLASELTSLAWPALIDAGDEGDAPWAVIETPGRRTDGTFPFSEPQLALNAARGLAMGVAEAEGLLLRHCTSPHLSVRASMLGRDENGRLRLHLAALDPEPDSGFPLTPATWMWTAEELFGQPQTARSNVFALGWLLTLMLTGRSPYGPSTGASEKQQREALKPLVAQGKLALVLPEALKAVEPILRRALSPNAAQRYANAGAFAEALAVLAPGTPQTRSTADGRVKLAVPTFDPRYEWLPPQLEARLLTAVDESVTWTELAQELDVGHSPRAKLLRGDTSAQAELAPTLEGERLELTWRHGYVRAMSVAPLGNGKGPEGEGRVLELTAFLQHPSLRFLNDLTLSGPLPHARLWLEVLQRYAPPGLRRITTNAIAATDTVAVDIAFRFPRWTWVWGTGTASTGGGLFKKLFGR